MKLEQRSFVIVNQTPGLQFKGGFVPRSDGFNYGYDQSLIRRGIHQVSFKWSAKSMIALNNPAVCGAVSWRLAEYPNQGFVLSFPFKIELPTDFVKDSWLYSITATAQYKDVIDYLCENLMLMKPLLQREKLF
jgi:hypothetical protein